MKSPHPFSQLQIRTGVKCWHALAVFSGQPKLCQQMLPSHFQRQFSLHSSDDPLASTRFTPMDIASVHQCTLSFKPKSPKTKQKVTSRVLFPVLPCSLSPDIPSVAQLPVCEKYIVEIWNSLKMYCVECNKMMIFLYKYLGVLFLLHSLLIRMLLVEVVFRNSAFSFGASELFPVGK